MLSEAGESAERRVKAYGDLEASQLVLYGAGTLGQTTLTRLRRLGIEPVAFADDTPDKQGRTISGLRVMKPLDAVAQFGGGTVFVVTILNPFSSFLAVERRLRQVTNTRVISFLHLAWAYPEEFLPHYQFDLPHHLLSQAEEIKRASRLFADDKSRDQFLAHIR